MQTHRRAPCRDRQQIVGYILTRLTENGLQVTGLLAADLQCSGLIRPEMIRADWQFCRCEYSTKDDDQVTSLAVTRWTARQLWNMAHRGQIVRQARGIYGPLIEARRG